MAWRIHESVVRGEVDNRVAGRVQGRVWLLGRAEPIELDLAGNCLKDLAGCRLTFANPAPQPGSYERLNARQRGVAGDMTASRKVRVLEVPVESALALAKAGRAVPEHKANCLYLEWYSEGNGRVVIESVDYELSVSEPVWTMSAAQDLEQRKANQQAIVDWMERLGSAMAAADSEDGAAADKPLDEFEWEKQFRESDALTDKYLKVLEKYQDHPDREKLIAREMGWSWLEEALDADEPGRCESAPDEKSALDEFPPLEPNPLTEGVDWVRDEDGRIHHPLAKKAFDLSLEMWRYGDECGWLDETGDADLREMVFQAQTTAAKLAGALNGLAYDDDLREPGFVVAALKRALAYLNKSIGASKRVAAKQVLAPECLEGFRQRLFAIREQALALMHQFRAGQ